MAESEEELESLLMRVKEQRENASLKLNIQETKIMASGPITSGKQKMKKWKHLHVLFSWAPKSLQTVTAAMKLKKPYSFFNRKSYDKPIQSIRKQRYHLANKGPCSESCGFSSSHVWIWELDHKEGWALKHWCFWTMVLKKILESLGLQDDETSQSKGNQPRIFIGRADVEAETPTLWLPDEKNWLIQKDSDAGKDWSQKEKGVAEDEMVGWHQQLNGHEFEQILGHS